MLQKYPKNTTYHNTDASEIRDPVEVRSEYPTNHLHILKVLYMATPTRTIDRVRRVVVDFHDGILSEKPNLDLASKPPKAPAAEDNITWGLQGWRISSLVVLYFILN